MARSFSSFDPRGGDVTATGRILIELDGRAVVDPRLDTSRAGAHDHGPDGVGEHVSETAIDLDRIEAERERIRATHLHEDRPAHGGRGVHHVALLSSDVERTVRFYQELLGFPLTEIFENRDYRGSNHFFFDIGHGNLLAFFDFPDLDLGAYAEVLGGLHHLAISVEPEHWQAAKDRLDDAGVDYQIESGSSLYLRDPDGARVELISDPLGEMYGSRVL